MKVWHLPAWLGLAGVLALSGCAKLPAFLQQGAVAPPAAPPAAKHVSPPPPLPAPSAGIKALLNYAGEAAVMPQDRQTMLCTQSKAHLDAHPGDYARVVLGVMAAVMPDCISPEQMESVLQPVAANRNSPYHGLAGVLAAIAQQRQASDQVLAKARQDATQLRAKLKALTQIETQLNQVKDRELQNLN